MAVGHSILVIVDHVLKNKTSDQELGGDYFDRRYREQQQKRLIHQLESLGLKVTVEELEAAASPAQPLIFITGALEIRR